MTGHLQRALAALAILTALGLAGCELPSWKKGSGHAPKGPPPALPVKAADASVAGAAFDLDEKTGRPKPHLILRLDYFPEPAADGTTLPACYQPFPPDFDLGFVQCVDVPNAPKVALTAKNVEQECYTNPRGQRRSTVAPVTLAGCKKGALLVHAFQPVLQVDVEVKDVN